jgi:hypothetical protein
MDPPSPPPTMTPTLVPLLDLATHPPRLIGMRPGLEHGRSSTVRSPPAGRPHLRRHHSLPHLLSTSTSAAHTRCSKTLSTPCTSSDQPSRDLAEALRLFPFVPGCPVLTPPTPHLKLYPPNLSISRTPSPLPPLSPVPVRPRLDDLGGVLNHTRGLRQDPLGASEDGQEAEAVPSDAGAAEGRG